MVVLVLSHVPSTKISWVIFVEFQSVSLTQESEGQNEFRDLGETNRYGWLSTGAINVDEPIDESATLRFTLENSEVQVGRMFYSYYNPYGSSPRDCSGVLEFEGGLIELPPLEDCE